jgi:hypothetical protein
VFEFTYIHRDDYSIYCFQGISSTQIVYINFFFYLSAKANKPVFINK